MTDKVKSVFISYRRQTSKYAALLVYKDLTQHGYDVFIDYESIDSGKFAEVIRHQIAARSHFVVILSPGCLDRTINPDDWLRQEIEYAIKTQRNFVPLLFDGFSFEKEKGFLTGNLAELKEYNGPTVPDGYFDDAMSKLRNRFLKQPAKGTVRPAPPSDKAFVQKALQKADRAADQKSYQDALRKYRVRESSIKEEILELMRDQFTLVTTFLLAFLTPLLTRENENPALVSLGLYLILLIFISFNSVHILLAQKKRPGISIIVDSKERQTQISVPKYPTLHPFAKGGLMVSFIMLVSMFFISHFQGTFSPAITTTPIATLTTIANVTWTVEPSATNTNTVTPTLTPTTTITSLPIFTKTRLPTSTVTPSPTSDPKTFRGLDQNCIDQNYWEFPTNEPETATYTQNSKICYNLSTRGINAQLDGLRLNISRSADPTFGMYTTLPSHKNLDISFKLEIEDFRTTTSSKDSVLVLGISTSEDSIFRRGEYLFHGIRPRSQTTNIIREVGASITQAAVRLNSDAELDHIYDILFSIQGIDLYIYVDDTTLNYYPRSLSQFDEEIVFWVGYQLPANQSNLEAWITEFSIVEK